METENKGIEQESKLSEPDNEGWEQDNKGGNYIIINVNELISRNENKWWEPEINLGNQKIREGIQTVREGNQIINGGFYHKGWKSEIRDGN